MNDNDIKLLQLIQEVKKGNKDVYDEISNLIIDEVYNLVSFIYKKEETRKKLARHVIVKIIRSIDGFNSEAMDIHMWIARFTTIEIYSVYSKQNGNIFSKTNHNLSYKYNSIEEDTLFENCAAEYNRAFIDIAELNKMNEKMSALTKAQKIIYEMFCYECFSIDEIEDVLEVDSTYIIDAIAGMREQLCALPQESLDSEEVINSIDIINHTDNNIAISEEEAYELNNIYSNQSKNNHSKYYILFSKKISKKSLISAASCAAVILLAVIVVIVVSIRDKNSASNVANFDKMSTQSTASKTQKTTTVAAVSTKKDDESTTQTEEETEVPSTKSNSGNNQRPTSGSNTYVKPSSNVPNNPTQASTNKPIDDEPDNTTKPDDEPDNITKPSDEPDDTTKPSDEPDDTTKPSDEPDDTTKPSDEPDDTTKPNDNPDDTTTSDDNTDDTQNPNDNSDKTSNEDDSTQNEH